MYVAYYEAHLGTKHDLMRNYFLSAAIHIILLLLLLGLFVVTPTKENKKEMEHVIVVDFSNNPSVNHESSKKKNSPAEQPNKSRKRTVTPPKEAKPTPVKKPDDKALRTSQKPKEAKVETLQEKSTVVKEVIPPSAPKPSKEEIEAAKREQEKAQKVNHFKDLLSRAKKTTATESIPPENGTVESAESAETSYSGSKNSNIKGVLGNRRVLKTPKITDNSQKKGRVVVKICVDAGGAVISSKYTMMGSTTSDSYLIGLAEKGAKQYVFSPSKNPKECGNVTIDFQLK